MIDDPRLIALLARAGADLPGTLHDRGDGAGVPVHGSYPSGLIYMAARAAYKAAFGDVPAWVQALPLGEARQVLHHAIGRGRPLPSHLPGLPPATVRPEFAVLHIPHAATRIPPVLRRALLLDDDRLAEELRVMTDSHTDWLFGRTAWEAERVVYPWSRLICDPERFCTDAREPMAGQGMGVIYTRCHDGLPLRRAASRRERSAILSRLYWPHHARLAFAVGRALARHDRCLVIDCHSFAARPLPHESDQDPDRPDICIGTDPFHTPTGLAEQLERQLQGRLGLPRITLNRPFAGALVPAPFHNRDRRVAAVMIEVNRRLYMDEATGHLHAGAAAARAVVTEVIAMAAAAMDALWRSSGALVPAPRN